MDNNKPLGNSDICIDGNGAVGIIGGFAGGQVQFYAFDEDGNTGAADDVPIESLTRATLDDFPASRRAVLADEQWAELGYQ